MARAVSIFKVEGIPPLAETGAEILLSPNGSPFEKNKDDVRLNLVVARVTEARPRVVVDDAACGVSMSSRQKSPPEFAHLVDLASDLTGTFVLWATDDLTAHISGIGSIDYFGQPQVQRSVSGMGTITARGDRR